MKCKNIWDSDVNIPRYLSFYFRLLDCGHSLCDACLRDVDKSSDNAACPKCHRKYRCKTYNELVKIFPKNFALMDLVTGENTNNFSKLRKSLKKLVYPYNNTY